ncbi:hypothetical protein PG996_008511 [Apiospora saccharicola]|uniref:Uncharacterized protein n=1 Tax=Apiospora saccharicola TaxID=335842 RepID=A0ABR1V1A0_9PEZI
MASLIRFALATEAVFNVLGAVILIVFPQGCLSLAVAPSDSISGSAALLCQVFGAMVLSLSVPLFLCIPDSTAVYEKRRIVYKTMAAGEIAYGIIGLTPRPAVIILFLRASQDYEKTGFTPEFLTRSVLVFAPALAWHSYAVFVNPAIMRTAGAVAPRVGTKKVQ